MHIRSRAILFNKDNEVLLVRHKGVADWWCLPGGHIDEGEQAVESMHRELREELDLEGVDLKLRYVTEIPHIESIEFLFVGKVEDTSFLERVGSHNHELEELAFHDILAGNVNVKPVELQEMIRRGNMFEEKIEHEIIKS